MRLKGTNLMPNESPHYDEKTGTYNLLPLCEGDNWPEGAPGFEIRNVGKYGLLHIFAAESISSGGEDDFDGALYVLKKLRPQDAAVVAGLAVAWYTARAQDLDGVYEAGRASLYCKGQRWLSVYRDALDRIEEQMGRLRSLS